MTIPQSLALAAPYLLIFSAMFAAILGIFLFVRARVAERPFNGVILPIAAASHFLLGLGTVAALEIYMIYLAKLDQADCMESAKQQIRAGANAMAACNLLQFELWEKRDANALAVYLVMSGLLFGAIFLFYRSRFERGQHVQA